jgi:tRNA-intron endonuclease, archaea type
VRTSAGLVLSFTEAEALRRRGVLDIPSLESRAAVQPHFKRTLAVFEALRRRGVVAKSGFKFGTHLRGYEGAPDEGHAKWLVQCVGEEPLHWSDLARAIRVAHGVRKAFLLANGDSFLRLSWFKP